jgi:uncharacterized spore protein YtfJ
MEQFNLAENVNTLFTSLENFTQREGIIGKPVVQGDKTFLPVVSITIGYAGGNAAPSSKKAAASATGSMAGETAGALGLGAKLCTDAIILIDNQNVSLLPTSSAASNMMDKIPEIISGINQNKQSGQSQNQTTQAG